MTSNILKKLASGVLLTFISFAASAFDVLQINSDSNQYFSGQYQADQHQIEFSSSVEDTSNKVHFSVKIDGELRKAAYNFEDGKIVLTSGGSEMTSLEQELLYDAAEAIMEYTNTQSEIHGNNLLVLVGAMDLWAGKDLI